MKTDTNSAEAHAEQPSADSGKRATGRRRLPRKRVLQAAGVALLTLILAGVGIGLKAERGSANEADAIPTTPVVRGELVVDVKGRGALWDVDPLQIKNEVEGWSTILEIVDAGTVITEQDVKDGKVLIKLDSASLEETEADRQMSFYRAEAGYAQAKENLDIQRKQNESDVAAATLKAKFAEMDLAHYLGDELAPRTLQDPSALSNLAEEPSLGGTARQQLRDLQSRVVLADANLARADDTLEWTRKLYDKQYASGEQLAADQLAMTRAGINKASAEQALDIYRRYTLPKEAEQLASDRQEALRDLDRVVAKARSELAQAEARLKSSDANLRLERERLDKVRRMIEKSTIRAPKPGRLIYGPPVDAMTGRDTQIEEGASIQEGAVIVRIPDLNSLAARVNIPEARVDMIKPGQPAAITLDALPERVFPGRVTRVSPMANADQTRLNPNAKVYTTDIAMHEVPPGFIPGMAARVDIIVADLKDVLYIPVQCVFDYKGVSFCWVKMATGPQPRDIVTGLRSDRYAEITQGLREGEQVYLASPGDREQAELDAVVAAHEEALRLAGKTEPGPMDAERLGSQMLGAPAGNGLNGDGAGGGRGAGADAAGGRGAGRGGRGAPNR
jgi:HlyD family secretion protein